MSDSNAVFEGETRNGRLYEGDIIYKNHDLLGKFHFDKGNINNGQIFYKNGDVYRGHVKLNLNYEVEPKGDGTLIYNENSIYELRTGTFYGLLHSVGDLCFKDGRTFTGTFDANSDLFGLLTYPNDDNYNSYYRGYIDKYGYKQGRNSMLVKRDETRYLGQFVDDVPVGKIEKFYTDGRVEHIDTGLNFAGTSTSKFRKKGGTKCNKSNRRKSQRAFRKRK